MQQILKSALLRLAGRVPTAHPTADVLSAFSENALLPGERKLVLSHLVVCGDCRERVSISSTNSKVSHKRFPVWRTAFGVAASLCLLMLLLRLPALHQLRTPLMPEQGGVAVRRRPSMETQRPETQDQRAWIPPRPTGIVWRFDNRRGHLVLETSNDDGQSWKPVLLNKRFQVQSLAWSGETAWVRGQDGVILESRDRGLHWTAASFSDHQQLADAMARTAGELPNSLGKIDVITPNGDRWTRVNGIWTVEKTSKASR